MVKISDDRHTEPFPPGFKKKTLFALLLLAAAIVSTIIHELGHCVAYWAQNIPAALSLTKEFPLQNITVREFAIGSAGGPAVTIIITIVSFRLYARAKKKNNGKQVFAALVLANIFYFFLRSLIAVRKKSGGELERAANLFGQDYLFTVLLFLGFALVILILCIGKERIKLSFINIAFFLILFIIYGIGMAGLEAVDRTLFWEKFPTIQVDNGYKYNEHK
ncbi:MAG: hypothetical protein V1799_18530 [bacterium]